MVLCLTDEGVRKLKKAIKEGKINPNKLLAMTSVERRAFFDKFLTEEQAKIVNILFEKKLLLKNQEKGIVNWAREITGIGRESKLATIQKIKDTYAEKARRKFDPAENESFLNELTADIYGKRYRADVSLEEAQQITELSQDVQKTLEKRNEDLTWNTKEDALDFGSAKVALDNYTGVLQKATKKPYLDIKEEGISRTVIKAGGIATNFIAENARAIVASVDNSFWGRQGISALFRPATSKLWAKNFAKSFQDIYKTLGGGTKAGNAILDGVKAEIYSRPNYSKGLYEMGEKLDIGISEEEFPTSAPEKIPALGRVFKAAEVAYTAGAMRLRADIADKFYGMAEKINVDMTDKIEVGAINALVNDMTGRGSMKLSKETQATMNKMFFSIKFFKANLNKITKPFTGKTKFTRKQAGINLLTTISSIAVILAIAKALNPDSVEEDPTSANFGKIRLKNTRIDITGGMSPILTLIARIFTNNTKSSITGLKREMKGFGVSDGMDALWNFTENKFSPLGSTIKELVERKTFEGDKPTFLNMIKNLTVPMIIEGAFDTHKIDGIGMALLAFIADGIGISVNTYSFNDNWNNKDTQEMKEFKENIGQEKFNKANKEYVQKVNDYISTDGFIKLSDKEKEKQLIKVKNRIKKIIFKKY